LRSRRRNYGYASVARLAGEPQPHPLATDLHE